jgi:N-acetylglutamate synthase-like GNAT family acetyltransferase
MEPRIRRATLDDLETLRKLWAPIGFEVADLEKRLTEFQVGETEDGKFIGAVGFQLANGQGWIHHEAYADSAAAETVRALFWKRLQVIAANHGVLRLWVRENSLNWASFGFQAPSDEDLKKLPEAWDRSATGWQTLPLKDESAIEQAEREMALFMATEKRNTEKVIEQAKLLRTIMTIVGFILAFILVGGALWLYVSRKTGGVDPTP